MQRRSTEMALSGFLYGNKRNANGLVDVNHVQPFFLNTIVFLPVLIIQCPLTKFYFDIHPRLYSIQHMPCIIIYEKASKYDYLQEYLFTKNNCLCVILFFIHARMRAINKKKCTDIRATKHYITSTIFYHPEWEKKDFFIVCSMRMNKKKIMTHIFYAAAATSSTSVHSI